MWCLWTVSLVSCALVAAGAGAEAPGAAPAQATTHAPLRTLDRHAAELAWRSWLQSPESGNQNAPPRRITTKSLFITPLVCPKGQRLDRNGCVQVVTVNKGEHERILLEQLNALFTSAPSGDIVYDYGDDEPGPLQLSIPIGLDPQAAPLQAQEPSAQAQELSNQVKVDKKGQNKPDNDVSIEAELELLKLQHSLNHHNDTAPPEDAGVLNHNVLNNFLPLGDKPKRDSLAVNSTEIESSNNSDEGQKELVFGHVNIDPILLNTESPKDQETTEIETERPTEAPQVQNDTPAVDSISDDNKPAIIPDSSDKTETPPVSNKTMANIQKDGEQAKLNPENDYGDIGEAIKLISRYAEVTTDDNFTKDQKKHEAKDDSILGTRTRLQHRRNKPKPESSEPLPHISPADINDKMPIVYNTNEGYYRYPWQGQHSPTPPPDYPFRHLQDYWPGRNKIGGVYATHENPRRHHHNYFRPRGFPYVGYPGPYPGLHEAYPGQLQGYPDRAMPRHAGPMRANSNNQDLYSLLGLRHWFSSEGTSKR